MTHYDIWALVLLLVIRMRYLNRNLRLPICAEEGKHLPGHPEFCTLEAFKARVKELTPDDWNAECARAHGR
jgi:acid phosphatase